MTNPRDTGRYNVLNDALVETNVQVDFAWGNIPMQPNDDRGMAQLDPELDSHIIATAGYEGFPAFITGAPFDDTITNIEVPNLVGLADPETAQATLANAGLVLGNTNPSTVGANSGNDGKVKSQSPAAGTLLNEGDAVDIVVYDYVVQNPTGPIAAMVTNNAAIEFTETAWMYLLGRTIKPTVGDYINVTGNGATQFNNLNYEVMSVTNDDAYNTGGTKVVLRSAFGAFAQSVDGFGGTWTKVA